MPKFDFISFILIILLPLFLLSVSVYAVVFDESHYAALFEKFGVYDTVQNADLLNEEVLGYLNKKGKMLSEPFNEREISHMEDVKGVFWALKRMLIVFPILFIAALVKWKARRIEMLGKVVWGGSIASLGLFLAIIPFSVFAFPSSFDVFHRLFFDAGTYLFNPSTDILVQLYPEALFFSLAWRVALLTVLLSGFALFYGVLIKKDLKH